MACQTEYIKRLYRQSIYQRDIEELRHHFAEGLLESLHLFGEADGEAHVRGPHRPPPPYIDLLGLQREDNFPDWALHVDHEAVRLAGHVTEVVLEIGRASCRERV